MLVALAVFFVSRAGHETCPTMLEVGGRSYSAVTTSDEVIEGAVLGDGTEHGCGDAGRWSQAVSLARIPGVNPHIALATPSAGNTLYIAVGVSQADLPDRIADLIGQS